MKKIITILITFFIFLGFASLAKAADSVVLDHCLEKNGWTYSNFTNPGGPPADKSPVEYFDEYIDILDCYSGLYRADSGGSWFGYRATQSFGNQLGFSYDDCRKERGMEDCSKKDVDCRKACNPIWKKDSDAGAQCSKDCTDDVFYPCQTEVIVACENELKGIIKVHAQELEKEYDKRLRDDQEQKKDQDQEQDKTTTTEKTKEQLTKQELKDKISQVEDVEKKIKWKDNEKTEEVSSDKPGKGKKAYMFFQGSLSGAELFSLMGKMQKWEKHFEEQGYEVVWGDWEDEAAVNRFFSDPNAGAFDYFGHNGLDTKGNWLSNRLFKLFNRTPAIAGSTIFDLQQKMESALFDEYIKTMSLEEAQRKAANDAAKGMNLNEVNIHTCYSADDDDMEVFFVKNGGTFRGEIGPYHGFDSLDVTKISNQ